MRFPLGAYNPDNCNNALYPLLLDRFENIPGDERNDREWGEVGDTYYNCTGTPQRSTINWSETTGQSNSFGVSLSAEYGFSEVFSG